MRTTVMISTRDRCAQLELTCSRLLELRPAPDEILICADGCVDDTARMLHATFPQFKLIENPAPKGSVYSRDRMMRLARGGIVLSLDDDSYPIQRDFILNLTAVFSAHPEAAVVVFPVLRDGDELPVAHATRKNGGCYVSAYANCAAAMRRGFYLRQQGFPLFFQHMYEEPDYALQCYAAGAAVWFEPTLSIRHHESPLNRQALRRHHFNARNELWSVWLRCPWPWLAAVSIYRILRQLVYATGQGAGWVVREPSWWLAALRALPQCRRFRRPVRWPIYYRWMRLARNPLYSVPALREAFPPPC